MHLEGYVGASWPPRESGTERHYMEYQDGTFMIDDKLVDKDGTMYTSLNGNGCMQLGSQGNIVNCDWKAKVLCEVTLYEDTHICLDNDHLTSVTLNSSTELDVPAEVRI